MEQWKQIKGYEGFYEVSNMGRVKSVDRIVNHGRHGKVKAASKLLKQATDEGGYQRVSLCRNRKLVTKKVHRLVCEAFLGESDLEVNHKNGNKKDNRLENLEFVSRSENVLHAFKNKLAEPARGSKNGNSKLTESEVRYIRYELPRTNKDREFAAKLFNVSPSQIKDIQLRRRNVWPHV